MLCTFLEEEDTLTLVSTIKSDWLVLRSRHTTSLNAISPYREEEVYGRRDEKSALRCLVGGHVVHKDV